MTNSKLLEKLYTIKNGGASVDCLISEVKDEITKEEAKKSGRAAALKACNRIIKSGKNTNRIALSAAWIDEDGRECVCDSFHAVRLKNPLNLEKIPENTTPLTLAGVCKPSGDMLLHLPEIGELKALIKTKKAEQKAYKNKGSILYDFGEDLPAVNAEFLLDMMEALPGATASTSETRPLISTIYFISEDGDGVLCPIRKAK